MGQVYWHLGGQVGLRDCPSPAHIPDAGVGDPQVPGGLPEGSGWAAGTRLWFLLDPGC